MVSTRSQSRHHVKATAAQNRVNLKKPPAHAVIKKAPRPAIRTIIPLKAVARGPDNEPISASQVRATDPTDDTANPLYLMPRSSMHFGLIQERLPSSLTPGSPIHIYCLLVQSILWNQTRGKMALSVLEEMLRRYPNPALLAQASEEDLQALLQPIGLWRQRTKRLIKLGQTWLDQPPCTSRTHKRKGYPLKAVVDSEQSWEVAHLPGVGPYALDAFRIFSRDGMHELAGSIIGAGEEEWRRVLPGDKDLRAYLIWRWERDGWYWNPMTGSRVRLRQSM